MAKLNIPPEERRIWTVSNFFTISRILALPFILLLIKAPATTENQIYLGIVLVWTFASDFLDGYIARKLNQVSVMGKILDPLADKIVTIFAALFTFLYKGMPLWIVVVIIARDVIILAMSFIVMRKKQFITVSNIYGKWAVTFIGLLIISYMFEASFLYFPLTILAMASVLITIIFYGRNFIHTLHV